MGTTTSQVALKASRGGDHHSPGATAHPRCQLVHQVLVAELLPSWSFCLCLKKQTKKPYSYILAWLILEIFYGFLLHKHEPV